MNATESAICSCSLNRSAGWRHVEVTASRTKQDYAQQLKYLVDVRYPDAEWITVVQDQLNIHDKRRLVCHFPTGRSQTPAR